MQMYKVVTAAFLTVRTGRISASFYGYFHNSKWQHIKLSQEKLLRHESRWRAVYIVCQTGTVCCTGTGSQVAQRSAFLVARKH